MISADITVARLLEEYPTLVEVLAGYHAHFKQLSDPARRRVMASRITVADAARMAGVRADELLAALRAAAGEAALQHGAAPQLGSSPQPVTASDPATTPQPGLSSEGREEMPEVLARMPEGRRVRLDVRDNIRRGEEPFARIMAAVKELAGDQALVLRVPFEPIPLYEVLGKRGFAHSTERHAADDWSVSFYRESGPSPSPAAPIANQGQPVIDVRGLEPPQPMVKVLEAIERLGPGAELEVRHDRRPRLLYPLLDERGFVHETDEPEPGVVRIRIRKGEA